MAEALLLCKIPWEIGYPIPTVAIWQHQKNTIYFLAYTFFCFSSEITHKNFFYHLQHNSGIKGLINHTKL